MRHTACGCIVALLVAAGQPVRAAESEQDQFEEKCIARLAEQTVKLGKGDRAVWLKELEAAYPGKVKAPATADKWAALFDLLAGKDEEWRRADAPSAPVKALFDKVVQKLDLGPVPSVTRAEFHKYARHTLARDRGDGPADAAAEADKVFRVLDRNRDGELDREELTTALRDERALADADGNGRISKAEYRAFFQRRVEARVKVLSAADPDAREPARKAGGKPDGGKPDAKPGTGLPDWWATLAKENAKQITLYEWRQGGRPSKEFQEMDLNGDGILTADEYLRWARQKALDEAQRRREEE
jgi:hypothetical protein